MNGLDLFSGIGGLSLALRDFINPVAYCEIDPFCQAVLLSRMHTNDLSKAPIWDDICQFNGYQFRGQIDIIYGGFPCQDISCAGNGAGLEGKRSGLFFEIVRLAKEIKPSFIFLENVPAITTRGGVRVVREITEMGYDCRWCIISAQSIGALHKRERWFMLAHSKHNGVTTDPHRQSIAKLYEQRREQKYSQMFGEAERTSGISKHVAHSSSESTNRYDERTKKKFSLFTQYGINGYPDNEPSKQTNSATKPESKKQKARGGFTRIHWPLESREHWQETVSEMGKCSHGIPNQVDRLRALGNSVVPEQAKQAFEHLMGIEKIKA